MKTFRLTLLTGLLGLAGVALAASPYDYAWGSGEYNGVAVHHGRVRGTIIRIDVGAGEMAVSVAGGEAVVLHGTPSQLAEFRRTEVADVEYELLGAKRWLTEGSELGSTTDYAQEATVSGAITSIDKAEGRVTLTTGLGKTTTFLAHPDAIRSLIPGQFVSVTYQRVARRDWVTELGEGGFYSGTSGGAAY